LRSALLYLTEMLGAVRNIRDFVAGMDKSDFLSDEKTRSAVVRQFEVLGEAAKGVPAEIRNAAPAIEWNAIAGMRDRLIHAYFRVDYELVWDTIVTELPGLEKDLEELLDSRN
jgi:uncharacterized protein with HEPN domain